MGDGLLTHDGLEQLNAIAVHFMEGAAAVARGRISTAAEFDAQRKEMEGWVDSILGNRPGKSTPIRLSDMRAFYVRACREVLKTLGEEVPE